MKKWLLPMGSLTAIAVAVAVALIAAGVFDEDDVAGDGARTESDDGGGGPPAAGICLEGVTDCVDTIADPDGELSDEYDELPPDEPVTSDPGSAGGTSDDEQIAIEAALNELSQRLGVNAEEIAVGDVSYADWPNACLGAAGPDEMCAEVITPGFVVLLRAAGEQFEYHTDMNGNVRLAE